MNAFSDTINTVVLQNGRISASSLPGISIFPSHRNWMPLVPKLPLLLVLAVVRTTLVSASCPPSHYPAPALSACVPCSTMFQWQIMGEQTNSAIVSALVRLDASSKHVQCVTTNGIDCQWGRSELPGSVNDTSTLLPLGCERINAIYFPLQVYHGSHWCNRVWMFLYKYCGNNITTLSPSIVRAKSRTTIRISTSSSFGSFRDCNGTIAGGHALPGTTCRWNSSDTVLMDFDSRSWNTTFAPKIFYGYRIVLGNELFFAGAEYNLTIRNDAVEVFSVSPPSGVITFPITVRGINFPVEASACQLSFDVYSDLRCTITSNATLESENIPSNFPSLAIVTQVAFSNPFISTTTRLIFTVFNRLPVVASLAPTKAYGGGIVTVFGANFVPNVGTCSAVVTTTSASTALSCIVLTPGTLLVQINPSAAPSSVIGQIALTFTVPPSTPDALPFQVLATPVIIGPAHPYAYPNSIVTLIGTSFHPADSQTATCFICSNSSNCFVQSETAIVVQVSVDPGLCPVLVKLTTPHMACVTPIRFVFTVHSQRSLQILKHPGV